MDEAAGLSREVVEARLALAELEAEGPRLPKNVAVLQRQRRSREAPAPGAENNPKWADYVAYYEQRLGELRQGDVTKAPLRWESYSRMWAGFSRGLAFERFMVGLLREDAKLPRAKRRFLQDFDEPRIETHVGVRKQETGLRFADVLVVEARTLTGSPRRIETLSFKSRDLSDLSGPALEAQLTTDAREALRKYGETLDIRRESLRPLLGEASPVPVPRVLLIYEGGELKPKDIAALKNAVDATENAVPGVEVMFP